MKTILDNVVLFLVYFSHLKQPATTAARTNVTRKSFVGTFPGPNLTLRHHLVYQGRDDSSVQIVLLLLLLSFLLQLSPTLFSRFFFFPSFETRKREPNKAHDSTIGI